MFDIQQCRVALLAGGTSDEREISLESGQGASKVLKEAGYQVTVLDPANKDDLKALVDGDFDVAFICLHGVHGEDGTIQGFLETIGLPYTGSNFWSSATALDKNKAKIFYERAQIPFPASAEQGANADEICEKVGFPCVVKPVFGGSSLGLEIVESREELESALEKASRNNEEVVVEQYIKGTELTVSVLGTKDPYALPVIEIIPRNKTYDFDAKYSPGGSQHICPARLSDAVTSKVQEQAVRAHKILECSGVSRSDFILDENGDLWILETNTIPGMTTGASLLPDAARAAGLDIADVYTGLIRDAFEKVDD